MLQELLRGLTTHPCYPPNLPIPLQLALNWVVGLASSGIIYGGCQLTGSFVYFWLMGLVSAPLKTESMNGSAHFLLMLMCKLSNDDVGGGSVCLPPCLHKISLNQLRRCCSHRLRLLVTLLHPGHRQRCRPDIAGSAAIPLGFPHPVCVLGGQDGKEGGGG